MKILGEPIFAKDAEGHLVSRIGTIFFRTPGLVTVKGSHAMQRFVWLKELAKERSLTQAEEDAELADSVDLIFTENHILIRPDPERMDLAFKADQELQKYASKRRIRYLNTNSIKVRAALRERGENWRMSRHPLSMEDFRDLIERSKVSIGEGAIYYYNRASGTRYVTPFCYDEVKKLPPDLYRRQIKEFVEGLSRRNRHGYPEIDLFPTTTSPEIKRAYRMLDVDNLSDEELKREFEKINSARRMLMPVELRDESVDNVEWRNEMCKTLLRTPNETSVGDQELVAGIAPEFFRQIEWLPGARIVNGEVVFDEIFAEAQKNKDDPELQRLCDSRVKALFFNTTRLFGKLAYINIGRIANSLARNPTEGNRRGNVYILQYREVGTLTPKVLMIRLQKWGIAERLDEGKDLVHAIMETGEYADYILDRRLMCRQLGMNLPKRLGYGFFSEKYDGDNQYNGMTIRTMYFVRDYVPGIASDKVPLSRLRNPVWAQKFAFLMGEAAAVDALVGRRSSVTKELLFDKQYEVVQLGADEMPSEICITDHAGSFCNYEHPIISYVAQYAVFCRSREKIVAEYPLFVEAYAEGFKRKLTQIKNSYLNRRSAFDRLFQDRPYDTNGSGAYRWQCVLKRLEECDVEETVNTLKAAIAC